MENVKIVINEKDTTSPVGGNSVSSDIVFVPGLTGYDNTIRLFTKLSDFKYGVYCTQTTAATNTTPKTIEKIFGPKTIKDDKNNVTFVDKNYIYAYELLKRGMPVLYACVSTFISETTDVTADLNSFDATTLGPFLEQLLDKNTYSVKYITSGNCADISESTTSDNSGSSTAPATRSGDPDDSSTEPDTDSGNATPATSYSSDIAKMLMKCAATRGDSVAIIDYQKDETVPVYYVAPTLYTPSSPDSTASVYNKFTSAINNLASTDEDKSYLPYAAAFYPWANYTTDFGTFELAPSFAYLSCVANAVKSSPNWLAMAGVARGQVPQIEGSLLVNGTLTNEMAEECQPATTQESEEKYSLNCITDIRPYGYTVWGNRTLKPVKGDTVALNFLNIRNMMSDIKKVLYSTAKSVMFEQNSDSLWLRFKSGVTPLLNQLKSGNAIRDFKVVKNEKTYNGDELKRGQLSATVKVFPLYAVEYFELTVEISDQDVTVSQ